MEKKALGWRNTTLVQGTEPDQEDGRRFKDLRSVRQNARLGKRRPGRGPQRATFAPAGQGIRKAACPPQSAHGTDRTLFGAALNTRLLALLSDSAEIGGTAALGLASALAQDGWDTALIDANAGSALLPALLGAGEAGMSFGALLRGHRVQARAAGPRDPKRRAKGLYWLPAACSGDSADTQALLNPSAEALRQAQAALRDMHVASRPLHLVLLILPPGASALGQALLGMADLAVYLYRSDEAQLQLLHALRQSVAAQRGTDQRGAAPLDFKIAAVNAQGPNPDGLWLATLQDRPDLHLDLGAQADIGLWLDISRKLTDRLALPHPDPFEQYRRSAALGDVLRCQEAFALAWSQDRKAAQKLFDEVCKRPGASLEAAVGAVKVVAAEPGVPVEDLWHVFMLAVQKLRLIEPTPLVEDLFTVLDQYARRVGPRAPADDKTRMVLANANLKVHRANWQRSQGQDAKETLNECKQLLLLAAATTVSPQHHLRVAVVCAMHARLSGDASTWPTAESCLLIAENAMPESAAIWIAEVYVQFAVISGRKELLRAATTWALALARNDPARAHYMHAIICTHSGRRDEAWQHLLEVGKLRPELYLYAPMDPDLRHLFFDAGQEGYDFTLLPHSN